MSWHDFNHQLLGWIAANPIPAIFIAIGIIWAVKR